MKKKIKTGEKKKKAEPGKKPSAKIQLAIGALVIFVMAGTGALLVNLMETPNSTLSPAWRKQLDAQVATVSEQIEKDPKDAGALVNRAKLYNSLGELQKSVEDATQALMLDKNADGAYKIRAWSYGGLGQFDQAIKDCDTAIGINPKDAEAYNTRGWSKIHLKQYQLALEDLDEAAALNPNFAQIYVNKGWAHNEQKEYDKAIVDLTRALALDSGNRGALSLRADAYANSGQAGKAEADRAQMK